MSPKRFSRLHSAPDKTLDAMFEGYDDTTADVTGALALDEDYTSLDVHERSAKRRRVRHHAANYLLNRPVILQSASLRGPFEGWRNSWGKQRVGTTAKRPKKSIKESPWAQTECVARKTEEDIVKIKLNACVEESEQCNIVAVDTADRVIKPTSTKRKGLKEAIGANVPLSLGDQPLAEERHRKVRTPEGSEPTTVSSEQGQAAGLHDTNCAPCRPQDEAHRAESLRGSQRISAAPQEHQDSLNPDTPKLHLAYTSHLRLKPTLREHESKDMDPTEAASPREFLGTPNSPINRLRCQNQPGGASSAKGGDTPKLSDAEAEVDCTADDTPTKAMPPPPIAILRESGPPSPTKLLGVRNVRLQQRRRMSFNTTPGVTARSPGVTHASRCDGTVQSGTQHRERELEVATEDISTQVALLRAQASFNRALTPAQHLFPSYMAREDCSSPPDRSPSGLPAVTPFHTFKTMIGDVENDVISTQALLDAARNFEFSTVKKPATIRPQRKISEAFRISKGNSQPTAAPAKPALPNDRPRPRTQESLAGESELDAALEDVSGFLDVPDLPDEHLTLDVRRKDRSRPHSSTVKQWVAKENLIIR